ncbi:MAG: caspase family protein, partial [Gemmataceae bacterium]
VISVHNYLYANPITAGPPGSPDVARLINALNRGLNVPLTQIVHLSDAHPKTPRPPLRPVVEEAVKNFLATTRKQDRVMLFWVGHAKEIDGKAYLVPLEGESENAETLIPLAWVFDQLAKCECRQKVLVLDGNRHNLAQGEERPVPGPMTEGFVKALEAAPKGVQVWAACGKDQESNEFEGYPLGVFLDTVRLALTPEAGQKGALEGRFQNPDEPLPLDALHRWLGERVAATVKANDPKRTQTPLLIGTVPEGGAEYDAAEPAAKSPGLPAVAAGSQKVIRELLDETSLPSIKGGEGTGADLNFSSLPPFPPDVMKPYAATLPADAPLRRAIQKARATVWAVSTATPPADIAAETAAMRAKLRVNPKELETQVGRPGGGPAEQAFKNTFEGKSRDLARVVRPLEEVMDELEKVKELRDAEATPPRWKAHYDYVLARVRAQLAYLEEYNNLLGGMRRDLPPAEANHTGWKMAAKEKPGDSAGKKYEKAARKLYGEMIEANKQTPWEVLGKRERLNALGLEWQAF